MRFSNAAVLTLALIFFLALSGVAPAEETDPTLEGKWIVIGQDAAADEWEDDDLVIMLSDDIVMHFRLVPAQTFPMGSPDVADGGFDESPRHQVRIERDYLIQRTEVTLGQWDGIRDIGFGREVRVRRYRGESPEHPARGISWNAAMEAAKTLAAATGLKIRLPSEAEWECAARAGSRAEFFVDSEMVQTIAWNKDNSGSRSQRVATRRPNAFGLYDMLGNVREWCLDYYHPDYEGAPGNGAPRLDTETFGRVRRGGDYGEAPENLSPTHRDVGTEDYPYSKMGLRLVIETDGLKLSEAAPLVIDLRDTLNNSQQ